jgi:hypothetical protein
MVGRMMQSDTVALSGFPTVVADGVEGGGKLAHCFVQSRFGSRVGMQF